MQIGKVDLLAGRVDGDAPRRLQTVRPVQQKFHFAAVQVGAENAVALEIGEVDVTAGVRLDVNSITQLEVSPRAALVYRLTENHSFRLGYAHAFRKPTFMETSMRVHLISSMGIDELDVTNDNLKNRTIDSLEAGYLGNFFGGRLQIHLDAAYTWYRDIIAFKVNWDEIEYINRGGMLIPDINGPGIGFINLPGGIGGLEATPAPISAR